MKLSPLEVDRCLYKLVKMYQSALDKFPVPPEVDRYLYTNRKIEEILSKSFRPLSRLIGIYTIAELVVPPAPVEFPSPHEVDRFLYEKNLQESRY